MQIQYKMPYESKQLTSLFRDTVLTPVVLEQEGQLCQGLRMSRIHTAFATKNIHWNKSRYAKETPFWPDLVSSRQQPRHLPY